MVIAGVKNPGASSGAFFGGTTSRSSADAQERVPPKQGKAEASLGEFNPRD